MQSAYNIPAMTSTDLERNLFWRPRTIQDLAREQAVAPAQFEKLMGSGRELWDTNEEFEKFVADIQDRRHELSHA